MPFKFESIGTFTAQQLSRKPVAVIYDVIAVIANKGNLQLYPNKSETYMPDVVNVSKVEKSLFFSVGRHSRIESGEDKGGEEYLFSSGTVPCIVGEINGEKQVWCGTEKDLKASPDFHAMYLNRELVTTPQQVEDRFIRLSKGI
jgi:hypothetical protein